jgi:hypothetical protein
MRIFTSRTAIRVAPYLLTAGVIVAILWRYPPGRIAAEVVRGELLPLLPIALTMMVLSLLMVATADHLVYRATCGPLRWVEVVRAKAGVSLLDVINYAAGHGAYAVWVSRFTGATAGVAAGALLFIMAGDLASVCVAAAAACLAAPAVAPTGVLWLAVGISGTLVVLLLIGPYRLLTRDRDPAILRPWYTVPRSIGLTQLAVRLVHKAMIVVMTFAAMRAFGIDIPFAVAAVHAPIILLVASLPFNVGGFGAVTAGWLLMTPWAPGEQLLAFQFLWNLLVAGAVVVRGLPFVRRVVEEVAA